MIESWTTSALSPLPGLLMTMLLMFALGVLVGALSMLIQYRERGVRARHLSDLLNATIGKIGLDLDAVRSEMRHTSATVQETLTAVTSVSGELRGALERIKRIAPAPDGPGVERAVARPAERKLPHEGQPTRLLGDS